MNEYQIKLMQIIDQAIIEYGLTTEQVLILLDELQKKYKPLTL